MRGGHHRHRAREGAPRTDEELYDASRAEIVTSLAERLVALRFYDHTVVSDPPELRPGDLLIYSLPWRAMADDAGVILVHAYTPKSDTIEASVYWEKDGSARRDKAFSISADPRRPSDLLRAGMLWVRPRSSACTWTP